MVTSKKTLRTCRNGHKYYKTSDCPTCPTCEKDLKQKEVFLSLVPAPARRALESQGIKTLIELSKYSEAELLSLHGFGPNSIPKLKKALANYGLSFQQA